MTGPARLAAFAALLLALAAPVRAGQIGRDADLARSGWYANQPGLSLPVVLSEAFGQIFSTLVIGQVYAQPLVWNGTLLVVTEANWVCGLDPATGAVKWQRNVGVPWNASDIPYCYDLYPTSGITATPVIDDATGIAYFTAKRYVHYPSPDVIWQMHAISVDTGSEQPGFPVTLAGDADNDSTQDFSPLTENQRTGLVLMNGFVYAGFSAVCDTPPFQGWVIGVSTDGTSETRWVDRLGAGNSGGGIWMSGSGLASDSTGTLLLVTGNGMGGGTTTTPAPGTSPPGDISEAIVRLGVQANGQLQTIDFFTPAGADTAFDPIDADLGSGGVIALPTSPFGTAAYPRLLMQVGKPGVIYLLDARSLGGYEQGPNGGDAVVQAIGPDGGVWSKPAVWGGDGGWVYLPTTSTPLASGGSTGWLRAYQAAVDTAGKPTLVLAGTAYDPFVYSSSAPIVTSDGARSGSALVWINWSPDESGDGAELRAYSPVPVNGMLQLRWNAPIGQGPKFSPPGVADGRLYVGTRDGHVLGFGLPPSGAGVDANAPPARTCLGAPSPNPCRGALAMSVSLARRGPAALAIFDASGRRVRTLLAGERAAASFRVAWDGRDERGARVPPGLYLARLDAGDVHDVRRVLMLR